MAEELKSKDATKTGIRVLSVEESPELVTIGLSNGSCITADIVIGADGVRSCVRDAIDVAQPKPFQADECKLNASQTRATQTLKKFRHHNSVCLCLWYFDSYRRHFRRRLLLYLPTRCYDSHLHWSGRCYLLVCF